LGCAGPYFFALIAKISGLIDVDVALTTIFYIVGKQWL
jgi:hypothetical protein